MWEAPLGGLDGKRKKPLGGCADRRKAVPPSGFLRWVGQGGIGAHSHM